MHSIDDEALFTATDESSLDMFMPSSAIAMLGR
jgi:hypothetical protein